MVQVIFSLAPSILPPFYCTRVGFSFLCAFFGALANMHLKQISYSRKHKKKSLVNLSYSITVTIWATEINDLFLG